MLAPNAMLTPRAILLSLVVGAAAGALVALIVDRIFGGGKPALLVDAILGAIGFAGGAIGFAFLPAMQNITTTRAGNMIIRSTTRNYQGAYRLGFGVAVLLAALYEVYRYQRARRADQADAAKSRLR
jgi:hypothetical protein